MSWRRCRWDQLRRRSQDDLVPSGGRGMARVLDGRGRLLSEHTLGPWTFNPGDSGDDSVGIGPIPSTIDHETESGDCVPICTILDPCYRVDREPSDEFDEGLAWLGSSGGNGDLIAAGPDLLAAAECQQARERYRAAFIGLLEFGPIEYHTVLQRHGYPGKTLDGADEW